MTALAFDTLEYYSKLKVAGVPEAQAKVQVEVMQNVVQNYDAASRKELATKSDLFGVRTELKEDIQALRTELKEDIQALRTELKEDIQALRTELKEDIQALRAEFKADMHTLRAEFKEDIHALRAELKDDIQILDKKISDTKHELIKWLIGAMLAQSALIVAIMAFMK